MMKMMSVDDDGDDESDDDENDWCDDGHINDSNNKMIIKQLWQANADSNSV